MYFRMDYVYVAASGSSLKESTVQITYGSQKGLLVTEERNNEYNARMQELELMDDADTVAFFTDKTWLYLCGDWKNGCYSPWMSYVNSANIQKLKAYYEISPEKIPDCIYVEPLFTPFIDAFEGICSYEVTAITADGNFIFTRIQ